MYGYVGFPDFGVELNPLQAQKIASVSTSGYSVTPQDCPALSYNTDGTARDYIPGGVPDWDSTWWYDGSPVSTEFLGIMITDIEGLGSENVGRKPQSYFGGLGGGTLGPLNASHRTLKFTALVFSKSCRGSDFGIRALTSLLKGTGSNCALYALDVWTCCPEVLATNPLDLDKQGRWRLENVGLVDGINIEEPPLEGESCTLKEITWTMASESPWLYDPDEDTSGFDLPFGVTAGGACMDACDWIWEDYYVGYTIDATAVGETTSIVRIRSGDSPFSGLLTVKPVETPPGPSSPYFGSTDPLATVDPISEYGIVGVPANHTLVIDSVREQIILQDDVTGVESEGASFIQIDEGRPFEFISAGATTKFVSVLTHPCSCDEFATVAFDVRHREL